MFLVNMCLVSNGLGQYVFWLDWFGSIRCLDFNCLGQYVILVRLFWINMLFGFYLFGLLGYLARAI